MGKPFIVMISNKDCLYCQNAKKILNLFCERNKNFIELKVIEADDYKKNNLYGKFDDTFPIFIYIGKTGKYKKFDFINDYKTERTYDKLKAVVSELSKSL
jgi:hypothetical protein